jgi:hypothetical protein
LSFAGAAGGTWGATGTISFFSSGAETINTNGRSFGGSITFNNSGGGSWTLNANLQGGVNSAGTLTAGTLDLNNFNFTIGVFTSSNSTVRAINFGTGRIILTTTTAVQVNLNMATALNFSWSGTGGFQATCSTTRTFTTTGATLTLGSAPNLFLISGTSVATITTGSYFNLLDFGTTTFSPGTTTLNLKSLTLSSTGTYTGVTAQFGSASGGGTIIGNGATLFALRISSTDGTTTLGSAITVSTSSTFLDSGTLNLGGFTLTTAKFNTNTNLTRSVNFNGGNINLTGSGTSTNAILYTTNSTNLTFTGTGGFVQTAITANSIDFILGSNTTATSNTDWINNVNCPNVTLQNTTANTVNFTGRFKDVNMGASKSSWPAASGVQYSSMRSFTTTSYTGAVAVDAAFIYMWGVGTLTSGGSPNNPRIVFGEGGPDYFSGSTVTTLGSNFSTSASQQVVVYTNARLNLNNFTLTCSTFNSNALTLGPRGVDFGTGKITTISFLTVNSKATQVYVPDATDFTCTGTGGFECVTSTAVFVFGSTAAPSSGPPNAFNVRAFQNGSYIDKLEYTSTGASFTTLLGGVVYNMYVKSLVLSALPTVSGFQGLNPTFVGTGVFTSVSARDLAGFTVNAPGGTLTMTNSFTSALTLNLEAGTIALNSTTQTFASLASAAVSGVARAISGPGTLAISGASWTVDNGTGFTGSNYTINMTSASGKTFDGGGGSYGTLVQAGAGALTVSGNNTFADIQATTRPSTLTFTAGTTQTCTAFTLSGTLGNLVTINSTSGGTQATLSKSSGTVTANYLSLQDTNATGGATWNSLVGSTVVSNVTGWVTSLVSFVKSRFMAFF